MSATRRVTKAQVDKAWWYYCKNPTVASSDAHQKLLKAWTLQKFGAKRSRP